MGKIRTKVLGMEEVEKEQAEKAKARRESKTLRRAQGGKPEKNVRPERDEVIKEAETEVEAKVEKSSKKESTPKEKTTRVKKLRGKKYQQSSSKVDVKKKYRLADALILLKKIHYVSFDETVELHLNVLNAGLKGQVSLPHGTGKTTKAVIATDEVLAEIEKGKLNFDVLIAHPSFMPKLVKYAKTLGPKGLMPNPKNGTISDDPEAAIKKLAGGAINYKTEAKFPLVHLVVGKVSFKEEDLAENIRAFINSIAKNNIKDVFLKSTMSPGIRIEVESV